MEIRKFFITELHPSPFNPRITLQPGDKEYKDIKKSLETFGMVEPVVVNIRDMSIIGGHQRVNILKDMGNATVDGVAVDLNEREAKALCITLNRVQGKWDTAKLDTLLQDLKDSDFDITITGFNELDLKFNPLDEWDGMPDYKQEDTSGIKLIVHFENEEHRQDFAKLVGQKLNKKTTYIWYPKKEWDRERDYQYRTKNES